MSETFAVGDRVADVEALSDKGEIVQLIDGDRAIVEFDEMLWDGIQTYTYYLKDLVKINE